MQQRQCLNRREKRAFVRIFSAAVLLCLLLLTLSPGCSLRSYLVVKKKTEALAEENKKLLVETALLHEEIRLLQTDERYIEKIAREKYGMLRSNEEVYSIESESEKKRE